MKFSVLVPVLCFFQGLAFASEMFGASPGELVSRVEQLKIGTEKPEPTAQTIEQISLSFESSIKLVMEGNNVVFELSRKEETLDEAIKEQLPEEMNEKTIEPVLVVLENMLSEKERTGSVGSFAVYVRLYDSNMSLKEQGTRSEALRTRCFLRLAELAEKLNLNTLLAVLADPLNAPRVPEMCPYILAASDYLKFEDKNSCKEHAQFLKDTRCLDDLKN